MINYGILHNATLFYAKYGFQRVEVPWTVTKAISAITKPPGKKDVELVHENDKVLVASAEQSFLYQYSKGYLPEKTKLLAITPCHRLETQDGLHLKTFIKAELCQTDSCTEQDLHRMIKQAFKFFNLYLPKKDLKVVQTGEFSYDIEYKGIELGSYGIRSCDFLNWIYGTACAEPRLSFTMRKFGISI